MLNVVQPAGGTVPGVGDGAPHTLTDCSDASVTVGFVLTRRTLASQDQVPQLVLVARGLAALPLLSKVKAHDETAIRLVHPRATTRLMLCEAEDGHALWSVAEDLRGDWRPMA